VISTPLKTNVDRIWDSFWSGGIANPLEVIEQVTYLLLIKQLDHLDGPGEESSLPSDLRWSHLRHVPPEELYQVMKSRLFPWLRSVRYARSPWRHLQDARFTIPSPNLLGRIVDLLDDIPMEDGKAWREWYEYALGKAARGARGQFVTPQHIVQLIVELMAPMANDIIYDPACGTGSFLVAASDYVRRQHPDVITDPRQPQALQQQHVQRLGL